MCSYEFHYEYSLIYIAELLCCSETSAWGHKGLTYSWMQLNFN